MNCREQTAENRSRIIYRERLDVDDLQEKMGVLRKTVVEFNGDNLLQTIDASLLLCFKGVAEVFHDIDITVDEKDIE